MPTKISKKKKLTIIAGTSVAVTAAILAGVTTDFVWCCHVSIASTTSSSSTTTSSTTTTVPSGNPGVNYEICLNAGTNSNPWLTSPYTYSAVASGVIDDYTVAQYEALTGYGTTLPALPSYITGESSSTMAAAIYGPGSNAQPAGYSMPQQPILMFFEGGSYGPLTIPALPGDLMIGGSATGYPEPLFNNGYNTDDGVIVNTAGGASYGFSGGTLTGTGTSGSNTVTLSAAGPANNGIIAFADGTDYTVSSGGGTTTITLTSNLSNNESGATLWYNNVQRAPVATLTAGASVGATSVTLSASSIPLVVGEQIIIGSTPYPISAISGSQSSYTLTLFSPIAQTANTHEAVWQGNGDGGIWAQYLSIEDDLNNTGTIQSGAASIILDNYIFNGYSSSLPGNGTAIYDGGAASRGTQAPSITEGSTIAYNCLAYEGHSGIHEFGNNASGYTCPNTSGTISSYVGTDFEYNEILESPQYGGTGDDGDKWWSTFNTCIQANYFDRDGPGNGYPIWEDNGNSGVLINGNYFNACFKRCIEVETSFNNDIINNYSQYGELGSMENNAGVISIDQSGGWPIAGSNFNNSITVSNNTLVNNWSYISIWGAGQRSCFNPQEQTGTAPWNNASYCSGGFPNGDGDFSIYNYPSNGSAAALVETAASTGASSIVVNTKLAPDDTIGFTGQGANTYATSTTCTSSYSSCTITLNSATGFSTGGGQVQVGTSTVNSPGRYVGAVLNYSSESGGVLSGVTLANGSGTLVTGSSGYIAALEPYTVSASGCTGYTPYYSCAISPALTANVAAGANVYNDGTCYDYATSAALPTGPLAPDGLSYFDGCIWEQTNITVSGNSETFSYAAIQGAPNFWDSTAYQSCSAVNQEGDGCGTNFMAYQPSGQQPYGGGSYSYILTNSMASHAGFTTPITSLWNGVPTNNGGEGAWDDTWSGNTYNGPVYFYAYDAGTCTAPSPYACYVPVSGAASNWEGTAAGDWDQG